jgi:hypothetical protein
MILKPLCLAFLLLLVPASAQAATVSVGSDAILTYQAKPGERSALDVGLASGDDSDRYLVFTESREPLTAATGCTQITALRVQCLERFYAGGGVYVYPVKGIKYMLGDLDDSVSHYSSIEQPIEAYGEEGNDNISGADNSLSVVGVPRVFDLLDGGPGEDKIDGKSGNNRVYGQAGNDDLVAAEGNDLLEGGAGGDKLDGGPGADQLSGGSGNDSLVSGDFGSSLESDVLIGGSGLDTADYSSYSNPLRLSLDGLANDGALGENDNLREIENMTGGYRNDSLKGNSSNNLIVGGGGDDTISAGAGSDKIYGGNGDDKLTGGTGLDRVFGESGDDYLILKDGARDIGSCSLGDDSVKADRSDKLSGCEMRR